MTALTVRNMYDSRYAAANGEVDARGSVSARVQPSAAEDEVDGAHQAQARPQEVELERLAHVEHGERHEHRRA